MNFWSRQNALGFALPRAPESALQNFFPNSQCLKLDGELVSLGIQEECKKLLASHTKKPKLAVVLAGEFAPSRVYVNKKKQVCQALGFDFELVEIPSALCTKEVLEEEIERLNHDARVSGILVQLPLPNGIDSAPLLRKIRPEKDADGFHPTNAGLLTSDDKDAIAACTPLGVRYLLEAYGVSLSGKHAVVVGRSQIVGKPMATLLLNSNCTVTIAHSKTISLSKVTREADILVAAAGQKHLITPEMIKPGAVVIDVGMHRGDDGKLTGDVAPSAVTVVSKLTPVPKGIGPMTISMLLVNTACASWSKHPLP